MPKLPQHRINTQNMLSGHGDCAHEHHEWEWICVLRVCVCMACMSVFGAVNHCGITQRTASIMSQKSNTTRVKWNSLTIIKTAIMLLVVVEL